MQVRRQFVMIAIIRLLRRHRRRRLFRSPLVKTICLFYLRKHLIDLTIQ